ncbi:MAG: DNA-3-methyladenine glycosylase I [Prevotella sp.]
MSEKKRCSWCNTLNAVYVRYHDEEWGVAVHDDRKLHEMLLLETFQAGLSWECVLNKREAFRTAFDGFDHNVIALYGEERVMALASDPAIIRNKRKIRAAIANARAFIGIQREYGSFDKYIWHWTEGRTIHERGLTRSLLSDMVSADLRRRGMTFVGTTIIYSYMQAIGIISSHEEGCFLSNTTQTESVKAGQ